MVMTRPFVGRPEWPVEAPQNAVSDGILWMGNLVIHEIAD